jgi:broad specificity phosphatase PhoE
MVDHKEVSVLRIILIRHGQTNWNDCGSAGPHFRGRIDVALNAAGVAQAQALADCLALTPIDVIYSSPLERAMDTARPIANRHGQEVKAFHSLLDIDYGLWGGRSMAEVAEQWPELYHRWQTAPHTVQIPGGESLDAIQARIDDGLEKLLAQHDRQVVVLVGHQAVNKVAICRLLGLDNSAFWRIRQDTGCINRFNYDSDGGSALTINEVCHLLNHPDGFDNL